MQRRTDFWRRVRDHSERMETYEGVFDASEIGEFAGRLEREDLGRDITSWLRGIGPRPWVFQRPRGTISPDAILAIIRGDCDGR